MKDIVIVLIVVIVIRDVLMIHANKKNSAKFLSNNVNKHILNKFLINYFLNNFLNLY